MYALFSVFWIPDDIFVREKEFKVIILGPPYPFSTQACFALTSILILIGQFTDLMVDK